MPSRCLRLVYLHVILTRTYLVLQIVSHDRLGTFTCWLQNPSLRSVSWCCSFYLLPQLLAGWKPRNRHRVTESRLHCPPVVKVSLHSVVSALGLAAPIVVLITQSIVFSVADIVTVNSEDTACKGRCAGSCSLAPSNSSDGDRNRVLSSYCALQIKWLILCASHSLKK